MILGKLESFWYVVEHALNKITAQINNHCFIVEPYFCVKLTLLGKFGANERTIISAFLFLSNVFV